MKAIYDLLSLIDKKAIKNSFDERISQHQAFNTVSEIVEFENVQIYFSKFIPEEDIVPISRLENVYGQMNSNLYVSNKQYTVNYLFLFCSEVFFWSIFGIVIFDFKNMIFYSFSLKSSSNSERHGARDKKRLITKATTYRQVG